MTTTTAAPDATASTTARRSAWALWGAAAGLLGLATNIALTQSIDEQVRTGSDVVAVVEALDRTTYYLATMTGFASVVCLLVFAAGLARWAHGQASDSLALRVAPAGLVASAAALIAAYGVKGQLAIYLDGGFNAKETYPAAGLYQFFLMDDLAGYFGWFGVTVALGAIAVLALRERLFPRWIGAVCCIPVVVATLFLVAFGFPGVSGIIAPLALLVVGIGLSRTSA